MFSNVFTDRINSKETNGITVRVRNFSKNGSAKFTAERATEDGGKIEVLYVYGQPHVIRRSYPDGHCREWFSNYAAYSSTSWGAVDEFINRSQFHALFPKTRKKAVKDYIINYPNGMYNHREKIGWTSFNPWGYAAMKNQDLQDSIHEENELDGTHVLDEALQLVRDLA